MEPWRRVWREGLAPQLSIPGLEALQAALVRDDGRLLQSTTILPPPLEVFLDSPVEGACALGFCAWQGDGLETVAQVTNFFESICRGADRALGEPAACRHFLDWFDRAPRPQMRRQLLAEVNDLLQKRRNPGAGQDDSFIPAAPPRSKSRPPCRHCQRLGADRPRGLCWRCYYRPGVRELYPSTSKFARRGVGNGNRQARLPPFPTQALPGSAEKIALLEQRASLGFALWHPEDALLDRRLLPRDVG